MSFDDLFRKDRPNKMLQITPSRLVAAFTRTSGTLIAHLSVGDGPEAWGGRRRPACSGGFFWRRLQATPASA
jgi:hypothetical protein